MNNFKQRIFSEIYQNPEMVLEDKNNFPYVLKISIDPSVTKKDIAQFGEKLEILSKQKFANHLLADHTMRKSIFGDDENTFCIIIFDKYGLYLSDTLPFFYEEGITVDEVVNIFQADRESVQQDFDVAKALFEKRLLDEKTIPHKNIKIKFL